MNTVAALAPGEEEQACSLSSITSAAIIMSISKSLIRILRVTTAPAVMDTVVVSIPYKVCVPIWKLAMVVLLFVPVTEFRYGYFCDASGLRTGRREVATTGST